MSSPIIITSEADASTYLRLIRAKTNKRQGVAARHADISGATLSNIEHGLVAIQVDVLIKLINFYGLELVARERSDG